MAIDYEALFGGDAYDPCEVAKKIRPAYMKLIVEGTVQRVTFRDRTVEFAKRDTADLLGLLRQMESECSAKSGVRTRFAITAGARRV